MTWKHMSSKFGKIPRKVVIDAIFSLECEWKNCSERFHQIILLVQHLKGHIINDVHNANLAIELHKDVESNNLCQWRSCIYYANSTSEIVRHILFHAHHTKLKALGRNLIEQLKFDKCTMDSFSCNLLPEQLERPVCQWNGCNYVTEDYENYYTHIREHIDDCQLSELGPQDTLILLCKWNECRYTTKFKIKLKDHVRSHTHEKLIACPECGSLYSNKTKYLDHIKRQIIGGKDHSFPCIDCNKSFSCTKLLKQHRRYHESSFKCPFCPFIASTVGNIKKHILYRHQDERSFRCSTCPFACKSQYDLQKHTDIHECPGDVCACTIDDCDFQCKNNVTLEKHIKKKHLKEVDDLGPRPTYLCHLCDKKYLRTDKLCSHLKKKHQLDPYPQRFSYQLYEDGNYRIKFGTSPIIDPHQPTTTNQTTQTLHTLSSLQPSLSISMSQLPHEQAYT